MNHLPYPKTSKEIVGYFLVDKPSGITSHDVVDHIRKVTNIRKVGHAGTLDPGATGVLIVLVGKPATKMSDSLRGLDKSYRITMEIGYSTDSLDQDGTVTEKLNSSDYAIQKLTQQQITDTINACIGSYEQTVPLFSAVKVEGKKMYEVGYSNRKKREVSNIQLPKRNITVYSINEIVIVREENLYPQISFTATVSSGTYTRSLVRDIGEKLGLPATQTALRRLSIGKFNIKDTIPLEQIHISDIIPLSELQKQL